MIAGARDEAPEHRSREPTTTEEPRPERKDLVRPGPVIFLSKSPGRRRERVVRLSPGLVVLLVLSLIGSCANAPDRSVVTEPGDDVATTFGECPSSLGEVDYLPAVQTLAEAERWFQLDAIPPDVAVPDSAAQGATVETGLFVRGYDSATNSFVGPAIPESIAIHTSMLPGANWALSRGGKAYLALTSKGLDREIVAYTLVEADGEHFFAGECTFEGLTSPLRYSLGADYDAVMKKIVGMTDPEEIVALAAPMPSTSPTQGVRPPSVLNPEDASPELLASLGRVTLALDVPVDWVGSSTICSKIDEGWNDCIALYGPRSPIALIDVYFNAGKTIEFWLLDESADLTRPLQLIGTVHLSGVDESVLEATRGAVVRVDLIGVFAPDGSESVVRKPDALLTDAETWEILLTNSARSLEVTGTDLTKDDDNTSQPP